MDNFDLKKYLAEGKLHEEVGSDGRLYGHEGNPKLKHSKTYNSSNIDIEPGDYVIVPFGSGQSEGWVFEKDNQSLKYYEEKKSHPQAGEMIPSHPGEMIPSEMEVKIDFSAIRDIKNTGKEKIGGPDPSFYDTSKRYGKGDVYIVKIANAFDTIQRNDLDYLSDFSKAALDKIKKYDKNINK